MLPESLFKYLPQHDDMFPRIAQGVDRCRFVFIAQRVEVVTEMFRRRLRTAFARHGLAADNHCQFVESLDSASFAGVTRLADVFLDSVGWSGCNSSLEAIAWNVPVLTLPGDTMRGRHTMAILRIMGMEDMIAASEDEFVGLAVRLGRDTAYRRAVSGIFLPHFCQLVSISGKNVAYTRKVTIALQPLSLEASAHSSKAHKKCMNRGRGFFC